MPPNGPTRADELLRRDAARARYILTYMFLCLITGGLTLSGVMSFWCMTGPVLALLMFLLAWMLSGPIWRLSREIHLWWMVATDLLDLSLQRFLQRRMTRRHVSSGSRPTSGGASGSISQPHRPDGGAASDE